MQKVKSYSKKKNEKFRFVCFYFKTTISPKPMWVTFDIELTLNSLIGEHGEYELANLFFHLLCMEKHL